jgi:hypothetical protein
MLGQRPHQGFHFLVLDQTDAHPARVLQTRSEEMDALPRAIQQLHLDFSEIVLTELSRKVFETH